MLILIGDRPIVLWSDFVWSRLKCNQWISEAMYHHLLDIKEASMLWFSSSLDIILIILAIYQIN